MLDDLIILAAQKYLAPDWLVIDSLEDEEIMTKKMLNHINYDEKKEKKLSFILAVIPTLLTVFCIYSRINGESLFRFLEFFLCLISTE